MKGIPLTEAATSKDGAAYKPGDLGYVLSKLGVTWGEASRLCGLHHATLIRNGRRKVRQNEIREASMDLYCALHEALEGMAIRAGYGGVDWDESTRWVLEEADYVDDTAEALERWERHWALEYPHLAAKGITAQAWCASL